MNYPVHNSCEFTGLGEDGTELHRGYLTYHEDRKICQNHWDKMRKALRNTKKSVHRDLVEYIDKVTKLLCPCDKPADCDKHHDISKLGIPSPEKPVVKCLKCKEFARVYAMNRRWTAFCESCQLDMDIDDDGTVTEFNPSGDEPAPEAKCPTCRKVVDPQFVYQYDIQGNPGPWEAYCMDCEVAFDVATGKVNNIDAEIPEDDTKQTSLTFNGKKLHHMSQGTDKIYTCDSCKFETTYISEVVAHEKQEVGANLHYTRFKNGALTCDYCGARFQEWKDANKHETEEGKRANSSLYTTSYSSSSSSYAHCVHKPQKVLTAKEDQGWEVYAGRKWDCEPTLNNFDIVLNLSGTPTTKKHVIPFNELKGWEQGGGRKYKEINLDWPDRGVVDLPAEFWKDFHKMLVKQGAVRIKEAQEKNNKINPIRVVVFCIGGHGRTGTAVASMLVSFFDYKAKAAIKWVRTNLCEDCIETVGQEDYVFDMAGEERPERTSKSNSKSGYTVQELAAWEHD